MSNIRLYYPNSISKNTTSLLSKEHTHYVANVMRLKRGSNINFFNQEGEWASEVIFLEKDRVEVKFLNKMDIAISRLKKENKSLKLFFISVDPERDTPEVIKDYLNSFENNFVGITGESEKIFLLSKSWGIKSEKIFSEDGSYTVDHSSPIILLKNGKYTSRITHHDDVEESLKIIKKIL